MGTWPVENSPAGPRRHQTPLRTSRVEGGGGGGGGAAWGRWLGTGQVCTTWRVAAASRPRHKPSRAGGGADWRIPLRIGPALDRRRVLAGSGTRHRRGGAARGFFSGTGQVCATRRVAAASRPRHQPSRAGGEPGQRWTAGGFSPALAPVTDGAERLGDLYRGASILAD